MNNNTKVVASIFTFLMFMIVLVAWKTPPASTPPGVVVPRTVSSLSSSEKLYDFGMISMANNKVSHIFKISNPTNKDIKVDSLGTSCMCTAAFIINKDGSKKGPFGMPGMGSVPPANEVIKAGDSLEVEAVYDPNAHGPAGVGTIDRFIDLAEEGGAVLRLEIKANVTP